MRIHSKIHALQTASALIAAPLAVHSAIPAPPFSQSNHSSNKRIEAELAPAPVLLPMGSYVGELREKWQFPSDHIPIGMTVEGLNIASWNVLNSAYVLRWMEKQGLSNSLIMKEHVPVNGTSLTLRDQHAIDCLLEMTSHPTHPRSLFALQECSIAFLNELEMKLPPHFKVVRESTETPKDQNAVIYDTRTYTLKNQKTVIDVFSERRPFQDLLFERSGKPVRIINAHLPGNPPGPARQEFASYLAQVEQDGITLAMGDMNFNELEMRTALKDCPEYQLISPYCTNIDPYSKNSKAIDHFMARGALAIPNKPEELLFGLEKTASLLNCK